MKMSRTVGQKYTGNLPARPRCLCQEDAPNAGGLEYERLAYRGQVRERLAYRGLVRERLAYRGLVRERLPYRGQVRGRLAYGGQVRERLAYERLDYGKTGLWKGTGRYYIEKKLPFRKGVPAAP